MDIYIQIQKNKMEQVKNIIIMLFACLIILLSVMFARDILKEEPLEKQKFKMKEMRDSLEMVEIDLEVRRSLKSIERLERELEILETDDKVLNNN